MSIEALVSELVENNIHLWLEDGKLKFRAPRQGLPDHIHSKLVFSHALSYKDVC
jgi:hypothetical protein